MRHVVVNLFFENFQMQLYDVHVLATESYFDNPISCSQENHTSLSANHVQAPLDCCGCFLLHQSLQESQSKS